MILLDTDHVNVLKYPDHPRFASLTTQLNSSADQDVATTVITVVPCIVPGTLSCYGKLLHIPWDRRVQGESTPGGDAMEVAIHLPDDVAAAVPWDDVPRHLVEQIALEGYQDGWLSEEQVRRLLGYETRLEVHGFLKDHAVPLRYTLEHLEQDREAHRQLGF